MALRLTETEARVLGIERKRGGPLALSAPKGKRKVSVKSEGEETMMLHFRLNKFPEPEREYLFHPERKWRFDFAYPELKFAIEVEGGTRSGKSRHTKHDGFSEDCVKYGEATILGWSVMRFTTQQIKQGIAIEMVKRLLMGRKEKIA